MISSSLFSLPTKVVLCESITVSLPYEDGRDIVMLSHKTTSLGGLNGEEEIIFIDG